MSEPVSGYAYWIECLQEPGLKRSFATPEDREEWAQEHATATAHLEGLPWPTPHNFHSWAEKVGHAFQAAPPDDRLSAEVTFTTLDIADEVDPEGVQA